jgi:hypothetical protein
MNAALGEAFAEPNLSQLKRKWAIYSPGELRKRTLELGGRRHLIEGMIPERSIVLPVGDSGLGKSPLFYQAALCVTAGIPFLGHSVQQGRVLYLDYENGLGDVDDTVTRLSFHLGLSGTPGDLLLWNFNDSPAKWGQLGYTAIDMIREVRPILAIVDSLAAFRPGIEEKNSTATQVFQEFRAVIRDCGSSIVAIHHPKKQSDKPEYSPPPLEGSDFRQWFRQARGCRSLINGSDVRIGIAEPGVSGIVSETRGNREEIALVLRGFGRVRGEIPLTYIARVLDEDGEALGYKELTGASLLFNEAQSAAFGKLGDSSRFKDVQQAYGKGPQATNDFLKKCCNLGILRKAGKGRYEKVAIRE